MKYLLMLTFLLMSLNSYGITKVAVIDSGLNIGMKNLCNTGHRDLSGTGLQEDVRHASQVVKVINEFAGNANFCIIIYKFLSNKRSSSFNESLRAAIDAKVDVINISGGGYAFEEDEQKLIKEALAKGIFVVAAAGNEGKDLDKVNYYPASIDSRIWVAGCKNQYNYGSIVDVKYDCRKLGFNGTSFATAAFTGVLVKEISGVKL